MEPDDEVVEVAAVWQGIGRFEHSLIKPTKKIAFDAMAVHHITESMVHSAPDLDNVIEGWFTPDGTDLVFAAHNAQFDKEFLPEWMRSKPWICTYKCALHLFPDAVKHSNQSLRYELNLHVGDIPDAAGLLPHRALYDAWVTSKLLERMLRLKTTEQLIALTTTPVLLKKVAFGKHRGETWDQLPYGYLKWVTSQDFDDDVMYTADYHLTMRRS